MKKGSRNLFRQNSLLATKNVENDKKVPGTFFTPYLMTGFDRKCLHLAHETDADVEFTVEVDFIGDGTWKVYQKIAVPPRGYVHHEFPAGFSTHWIRVTADKDCRATAWFIYN